MNKGHVLKIENCPLPKRASEIFNYHAIGLNQSLVLDQFNSCSCVYNYVCFQNILAIITRRFLSVRMHQNKKKQTILSPDIAHNTKDENFHFLSRYMIQYIYSKKQKISGRRSKLLSSMSFSQKITLLLQYC